MINHTQFTEDLLSEMKKLADLVKAGQMKAYMKDNFEFLGVSSQNRKLHTSIVKSKNDKLNLDDIFPVMYLLWDQPYREMQYIAMDLSKKFCKKMDARHLPHIIDLTTRKSWWDTVDFLAVNQLGGALMNTPDKGKAFGMDLIRSEHMWLRRSALLFQLKYKEQTNFDLLTTFILATIHEKEFFITKAQGWALREYSKTNKAAVGQFIHDYKDQLSTLTIREGSKYV